MDKEKYYSLLFTSKHHRILPDANSDTMFEFFLTPKKVFIIMGVQMKKEK